MTPFSAANVLAANAVAALPAVTIQMIGKPANRGIP
jgi:hypothetical protein